MAVIEAVVGITAGVLWGYVRGLDFVFTELYNIFDNIPTAIVLILISYVATPSIWTMILGMSIKNPHSAMPTVTAWRPMRLRALRRNSLPMTKAMKPSATWVMMP